MASINKLRDLCQPLYGFVYKYFETLSPEDVPDLKYEFIMSPLEAYEVTLLADSMLPDLFKSTSNEDDVMDLWAHKELVLKTLVILTNLPFAFPALKEADRLVEAVALRDRLIDEFTNKILEDPNVLVAIQNGTIDEEIEKRRESKDLFNFKPLFEQKRKLVVDSSHLNFEEIPENF